VYVVYFFEIVIISIASRFDLFSFSFSSSILPALSQLQIRIILFPLLFPFCALAGGAQ